MSSNQGTALLSSLLTNISNGTHPPHPPPPPSKLAYYMRAYYQDEIKPIVASRWMANTQLEASLVGLDPPPEFRDKVALELFHELSEERLQLLTFSALADWVTTITQYRAKLGELYSHRPLHRDSGIATLKSFLTPIMTGIEAITGLQLSVWAGGPTESDDGISIFNISNRVFAQEDTNEFQMTVPRWMLSEQEILHRKVLHWMTDHSKHFLLQCLGSINDVPIPSSASAEITGILDSLDTALPSLMAGAPPDPPKNTTPVQSRTTTRLPSTDQVLEGTRKRQLGQDTCTDSGRERKRAVRMTPSFVSTSPTPAPMTTSHPLTPNVLTNLSKPHYAAHIEQETKAEPSDLGIFTRLSVESQTPMMRIPPIPSTSVNMPDVHHAPQPERIFSWQDLSPPNILVRPSSRPELSPIRECGLQPYLAEGALTEDGLIDTRTGIREVRLSELGTLDPEIGTSPRSSSLEENTPVVEPMTYVPTATAYANYALSPLTSLPPSPHSAVGLTAGQGPYLRSFSLPAIDHLPDTSVLSSSPVPATTVASISAILSVLPENARWFVGLCRDLLKVDLGAEFSNLLRLWTQLETAYDFKNSRSTLSARCRPEKISKWIRAGRSRPVAKGGRRCTTPSVEGQVDEFSKAWWVWWVSLQPKWRRSTADTLRPRSVGYECDWKVLTRPGQNGFCGVIAGLYWWGCAVRGDPDKSMWQEAVLDVVWVLKGMLSHLVEGLDQLDSDDDLAMTPLR